jgi:1-acyl-sn-glycerol-3-phosphate acyltransferase
MLKHNLVLFFPEGTRLRHNVIESVDHVKQLLRYGLLKEIYYHQLLPVQIQMSSNKEMVIDERKFKINKNVIVKTHLSKPIYPADYKTEQEFYDAIANQWYNSWIITHSTV